MNTDTDTNTIVCFTDGACTFNGSSKARASFAVVWPDHPDMDQAAVLCNGASTNNRAEFSALILAFKQAEQLDPSRAKTLVVYTDSMLMLNTVTFWMAGWKKRGWIKADKKAVANIDLVLSIDEWTMKRKVELRHVKAHTGKTDWASVYNDRVDKLAASVI